MLINKTRNNLFSIEDTSSNSGLYKWSLYWNKEEFCQSSGSRITLLRSIIMCLLTDDEHMNYMLKSGKLN